jgi:hypothetical protein
MPLNCRWTAIEGFTKLSREQLTALRTKRYARPGVDGEGIGAERILIDGRERDRAQLAEDASRPPRGRAVIEPGQLGCFAAHLALLGRGLSETVREHPTPQVDVRDPKLPRDGAKGTPADDDGLYGFGPLGVS